MAGRIGRTLGWMLKWTGRLLAALLVVAVLTGVGAYFWLERSLPQTEGERQVAGLGASVEILRDGHGIPHIYADSVNDAVFALGFVHAQDRLWQMHIQRRIAEGRLAELAGPPALVIDKFMRAFDFRYYAQAAYERLPPETQNALNAYAAGVNAVIADRDRPLPPEFFLLQTEPEPWKPSDTLMLGKLLAVGLSTNAFSEISRARLQGILGAEQLAQFLPPYPGDAPVALPDLAALYEKSPLRQFASMLPPEWTWTASNNWVVSGARTESGKPLLANDPHLGLTVPSVWYLAHMSVKGRNIIGGTMPGIAGVLAGRTDRIAWGVTNTGGDVQDLYLEKLNPDNPDEYLTSEGYKPFEKRVEKFKVRFGRDVVHTYNISRHGPVMPSDWPGFEETVGEGHALALAWTALAEDDLTALTIHSIWEAENWQTFRESLRNYAVPMQNFVYADVDGDIAFMAPARVPMRKPENDLKGLAPAPGWEAKYDWAGFIPFDELPQALNPAQGFVVTANHKIVPDHYAHFITAEWEDPYRARRIEELIRARPKHDVESFRLMQMDDISTMARDFMPLMLATEAEDENGRMALAMLRNWNVSMDAGKPEPLIFAAWYRALTKEVYADELGKEFKQFRRPRPVMMYNVLNNAGGAARWCDNVQTPEPEDCTTALSRALTAALKELRSAHGKNMKSWRWDGPHRAIHNHRPFGDIPLLQALFNLETPTSGGIYTVNRGHYRFGDNRPYAHVHGSGYRAVYDLADPEKSIFIISTGQSGNPYSPHYGDMDGDWAAGRYLPMITKRESVEKVTAAKLVLRP
jgi:penicillin G amidase